MGASLSPKKIQRRTLSAVIIAPIVLAIIWYGSVLFGVLLGLAAGLALSEMWQMAKGTRQPYLTIICGAIYILLGALFMYHLRHIYDAYAAFLFFFAMWGSDIGAYFAGKFIGGAKMAPDISPNKTWAGYLGAILVPGLVLMVGTLSFNPFLILAGIALGVAGQAGDLLISWVKRDAHVKDTGDLIPGHGGLLDRVDSLIPSVIVFLALLKTGILGI